MTGKGNKTDQVILAIDNNRALNDLVLEYLANTPQEQITYDDFINRYELNNKTVPNENYTFKSLGKIAKLEISEHLQTLYYENLDMGDLFQD